MQIQMIEVSEPYKEGNTFKIKMKYSREGKETERKLADVGDSKKAFAVMRYAKAGEIYEIDLVKNGEFQNWVQATKLEGKAGEPPIKNHSTSTGSKSNDVQNYIIRQNALTNAHAAGLTELADVLARAEAYETWVLRPVTPPVPEGFKDDIPY